MMAVEPLGPRLPAALSSPSGWKVTRNQSWVSPNLGPGLELYGNPQSCSSQGGRVPRALGPGVSSQMLFKSDQ